MDRKKVIWQTLLAILQTLTGLFLTTFFLLHFGEISLIKFGVKWFGFYTLSHSHPNLFVKIFFGLLAFAILLHGFNGLRIIWRYFRKIPEVHSFLIETKYRDSFLWYIHSFTGILIGITLIWHLIFKTSLQNDYYFASMILLLLSVIFHVFYGLRTVFVKYGFFIEHHKKITGVFLVIGLILVILGINILLAFRG